jgi:hypothetical protein
MPDETYLGDGLYASYDGFMLSLRLMKRTILTAVAAVFIAGPAAAAPMELHCTGTGEWDDGYHYDASDGVVVDLEKKTIEGWLAPWVVRIIDVDATSVSFSYELFNHVVLYGGLDRITGDLHATETRGIHQITWDLTCKPAKRLF